MVVQDELQKFEYRALGTPGLKTLLKFCKIDAYFLDFSVMLYFDWQYISSYQFIKFNLDPS